MRRHFWISDRRAKCSRCSRKDRYTSGSDCHGMHHRVPNLWLGREVLEKKLGHEFLENMDSYGTKLLKEHQIHP